MRSEIRSWRKLEADRVDWHHTWLAVHGRVGGRSAARTKGERALRLLGFRRLSPELAMRPDNLAGSVSRIRERLHGLGLSPTCFVSVLSDLDAVRDAGVRALWADSDWSAQHREAIAALSASRAQLEGVAPEVAMAETFLVGGRAIRQLVHDPLLPETMASGDARRALTACLVEYDMFGRLCWSAFLERHGVSHLPTPVDVRAYEHALLEPTRERA